MQQTFIKYKIRSLKSILIYLQLLSSMSNAGYSISESQIADNIFLLFLCARTSIYPL